MSVPSIPNVAWNPAPYTKGKNFCPNPIVRNGIPRYADSRLNRKVIGTVDWQKFWEQELYYIHNGYDTGGLHIPGRYYYYMNYSTFNTVMGPITPQMVDIHLELAYLIDHIKEKGKNFIAPKGRRIGISEAAQKMIVDYGYRFFSGYKAGVAAGLGTYVQDFMQKWEDANAMIVPELKIKTLFNNEDEVQAGYKITDEDGNTIQDGTKNIIYKRTMHTNPNLFKGLYLNDIIAEEMGEFKHAKEFYSASISCLKFGSVQKGNFWMYGTGGNMAGSSKDFQDIWHNAEKSYNAIRFFIPVTKFYFPFYGGATEQLILKEETPNLLHIPAHARIGNPDEDAAKENILAERKALLEAGDMKKYYEFLQNTPLNIKEVFTKSVSNNFNVEKLNSQGYDIESLTYKKYGRYKLEWVKKENGETVIPLQVRAVAVKDDVKDEECVFILLDGHPIKGFRNLFVAGVDSYDQDQSKTSKSLGAMVVRRRANGNGMQSKQPVCLIRTRPPRKEAFYDMCAKVAVYYGLYGNTLIDFAKPGIIQHFKDLGLESYLARRPRKFESATTTQQHDYGVSLNSYSRPMMVGLLQSFFLDYTQTIWLPFIIDEALIYDEYEADSDNDAVDALGISLMQELSDNTAPMKMDDKEIDDAYKYPEHIIDGDGDIVLKDKRPKGKDVYEGDVNLSRMESQDNLKWEGDDW